MVKYGIMVGKEGGDCCFFPHVNVAVVTLEFILLYNREQ